MAKRTKRRTRRKPAASIRALLRKDVSDAFADLPVLSKTDLDVLAEYYPDREATDADLLPKLRKLLDGAARSDNREKRGGPRPGPKYYACRAEVYKAHCKDPEYDFLAITNRVASVKVLRRSYVRRSCLKDPPLAIRDDGGYRWVAKWREVAKRRGTESQ